MVVRLAVVIDHDHLNEEASILDGVDNLKITNAESITWSTL